MKSLANSGIYMRCGLRLAVGKTFHCILGNYDFKNPTNKRVEYVVAGPVVQQAGDLLGLSKSGEVLISLDCWNILKKYLNYQMGEMQLNKLCPDNKIHRRASFSYKSAFKAKTNAAFIGSVKNGHGVLINKEDTFLHDFVIFLTKYSTCMTASNEGLITESSNDLQKENITQLYPAFIEESLVQIINVANASSQVINKDVDYNESKHHANHNKKNRRESFSYKTAFKARTNVAFIGSIKNGQSVLIDK